MVIQPAVRYLESSLRDDLAEPEMIFIGGPRQVGKTTLALTLLGAKDETHPAYLNWDAVKVRAALLRGELPAQERVVVIDEIHKYPRWRTLIKGFYDTEKSKRRFIVTGSAKLDYLRRGGDSLQGRYHYHRLHPFSVAELGAAPDTTNHLLQFGGFPVPCLRGDERTLRRWQRERAARVIHDDLRSLENVRDITSVEILLAALPERVSAPLSVKNLAQHLAVSFATAERWIQMLERLYVCFRIPPFGARGIRAVKKEQKLYLWDWSPIEDRGARFENMVASQLLKFCHQLEDREGHAMSLCFVRDTDKREIDFVVLEKNRPLFAVECKTGERHLSPHIGYFRERTPIPAFYQVHLGTKDYGHPETTGRVLPFATFCRELGMP